MDTKLTITQKRILVANKANILLHEAECCQQVKGGDPYSLLSAGKTHLGAASKSGLHSTRQMWTSRSKSSKGP